MKKILQTVYSYKNIEVTDAYTGKKEIAQYHLIFGIRFRIKYKRIDSFSTLKTSSNEIGGTLKSAHKVASV